MEVPNLYDNPQLKGSIPNLTALVRLEYLDLRSCSLTGSLPDLKNAPNLLSLRVELNDLSGTIPPALFNHPKLQFLNNNSKISGEIPDTSGLPEVLTFFLNDCNLTGPIPPSLQNNVELQYVVDRLESLICKGSRATQQASKGLRARGQEISLLEIKEETIRSTDALKLAAQIKQCIHRGEDKRKLTMSRNIHLYHLRGKDQSMISMGLIGFKEGDTLLSLRQKLEVKPKLLPIHIQPVEANVTYENSGCFYWVEQTVNNW
ncbi:hypothetical protein R1flu_019654 [Riccia fluitans]|uniref:Uncharacterized protein n=1 Tax=Riccia fluitans TaxID=41844 RepID=A0ABD1ZJ96_9MARC